MNVMRRLFQLRNQGRKCLFPVGQHLGIAREGNRRACQAGRQLKELPHFGLKAGDVRGVLAEHFAGVYQNVLTCLLSYFLRLK